MARRDKIGRTLHDRGLTQDPEAHRDLGDSLTKAIPKARKAAAFIAKGMLHPGIPLAEKLIAADKIRRETTPSSITGEMLAGEISSIDALAEKIGFAAHEMDKLFDDNTGTPSTVLTAQAIGWQIDAAAGDSNHDPAAIESARALLDEYEVSLAPEESIED